MKRKLVVKICTGTLCYIMGGDKLQMLDEYLSEDIQDQIDIMGTTCLDHDNLDDENGLKPPYVEVGDKVISEATIEKVVAAIKEELGVK